MLSKFWLFILFILEQSFQNTRQHAYLEAARIEYDENIYIQIYE